MCPENGRRFWGLGSGVWSQEQQGTSLKHRARMQELGLRPVGHGWRTRDCEQGATISSSSESAPHGEKDSGKTGRDATVHRVTMRTELRQGSWGWTKGMDSRDPAQVDATGSATLCIGQGMALLQGKKGVGGREGKGS